MFWTFFLLAVAIYWMPALIAFHRDHPARLAIAATNFLFGWTGMGWMVALIWALSAGNSRRLAVS